MSRTEAQLRNDARMRTTPKCKICKHRHAAGSARRIVFVRYVNGDLRTNPEITRCGCVEVTS